MCYFQVDGISEKQVSSDGVSCARGTGFSRKKRVPLLPHNTEPDERLIPSKFPFGCLLSEKIWQSTKALCGSSMCWITVVTDVHEYVIRLELLGQNRADNELF